jgi:pimeloyl-ACP methyl ester carboxylesterase
MGVLIHDMVIHTCYLLSILKKRYNTYMPDLKAVALKAYHSPDGRCIHYAVACLGKSGKVLEVDADIIGRVKICWIFFYPAGPNRRLLDLVLARYAPSFDVDNDVLFLCINRPGKGGTSSSQDTSESPEKDYVNTACQDIISIMDYYQVPKASLFYMCAGSTFAYSFATSHRDRTTGHIIGVSSWILRSCPPDSEGDKGTKSPRFHSLIQRMAMNGFFGPKWFVSSIAGESMNNMNRFFGLIPAPFIVTNFKKGLSEHEQIKFANQYGESDGTGFIDALIWMNHDGDGHDSEFINAKSSDNQHIVPCNNDGNAKDISVCLSTQEELGLTYNKTVSEHQQILLWHGTNDNIISVEGSAYLAC